jgi:hypothetical protein
MSAPSLAHRVRSGSIRLGLWASVLTFLFIETYAIPDQWSIGHASVVLVLALLATGVSIGVFVVVAAIGIWHPLISSGHPSNRKDHPAAMGR